MGPVSIGVEVQRNTDGDTPSSRYTAIFKAVKVDIFQMKICDIFLISAQSILDCEYELEQPQGEPPQ